MPLASASPSSTARRRRAERSGSPSSITAATADADHRRPRSDEGKAGTRAKKATSGSKSGKASQADSTTIAQPWTIPWKNVARYTLAGCLFALYLWRAYQGYKAIPDDPSTLPQQAATSNNDHNGASRAATTDSLLRDHWQQSARLGLDGDENAIDEHMVATRREAIRSAFKTSWNAYERDAFGFDNYHPISQHGTNLESTGIGYFIIDGLDSLILLGLEDEYKRARAWVESELTFDVDDKHHAFETTIRVLGGLLSAYHQSGKDQLYLDKAVDLADRLLPIFDTPSGIPLSFVNLKKRQGIPDKDNYNFSSVAEAGTLQLEFKYLSHLTGDYVYWDKVEKVMQVIHEHPKTGGLVPLFLNPATGEFEVSEIRLGSRADSYYEYLLKQYLQTGRTERQYQDMYNEAMTGIREHLVSLSVIDNSTVYTFELVPAQHPRTGQLGFRRVPKQDHLVCFLGGLLLLGVTEGTSFSPDMPLSLADRGNWMLGQHLTKTCMDTYLQSATGLGPEIAYFYTNPAHPARRRDASGRAWYIDKRAPPTKARPKPTPPIDARNILRPETVESLFVAWRLTHDPIYREWGWQIFQAFDKHCKVSTGGYASIRDVEEVPAVHEDRMETFFLSETLKYLFLLYSDDEVLPLSEYVFNTEAHPLPVFVPESER